MDPPVSRVIPVCPSITPSKCDVVPRVTPLATAQMMFLGFAPPAKSMVCALAMVSVPAICKIQVSEEPPEKVRALDTVTPVVHL